MQFSVNTKDSMMVQGHTGGSYTASAFSSDGTFENQGLAGQSVTWCQLHSSLLGS